MPLHAALAVVSGGEEVAQTRPKKRFKLDSSEDLSRAPQSLRSFGLTIFFGFRV